MIKIANNILRDLIWWRWMVTASWRYVFKDRLGATCFRGAPTWFIQSVVDSNPNDQRQFLRAARDELTLRKAFPA